MNIETHTSLSLYTYVYTQIWALRFAQTRDSPRAWWIMPHHDESSCIMMHHDASWWIIMEHDASWYMMLDHNVSCCIMTHQDAAWGIMMNHDSWWIKKLHDNWCITMDRSWSIMLFLATHDTSWCIMKEHVSKYHYPSFTALLKTQIQHKAHTV